MVILSKEQKEDFEKHVILSVRDIQQGIDDEGDYDENILDEPWNEKIARKVKLIDERSIVKSYAVGILNGLVWGDAYRHPPGFECVMEECGRDVALLRFNCHEDGFIRISINELVDRHMRIWIKNSPQVQEWVKGKMILPKAILKNATNQLIVDQRLFEYNYRKALDMYKLEIARVSAEMEPFAAEEKLNKPTPSGMHPAIS